MRRRREPWPTRREQARMLAQYLVAPLMLLAVVSIVLAIVSGPRWLWVVGLAGFPIAYLCTTFAVGGDSAQGWEVEKLSRGGTAPSWQRRLNDNEAGRQAMDLYIGIAAQRGYVADGPTRIEGNKIVASFVRQELKATTALDSDRDEP